MFFFEQVAQATQAQMVPNTVTIPQHQLIHKVVNVP